ncbi:MAG: (2Fe-2S)-binding protein, partial [Chloroflexi bacterium]
MNTSSVEVTITINNVRRTLSVGPDETLLTALRRASYFSVKYGCGNGDCGVCTVLLNGKPVRSCQVKAAAVAGAEITTLEGVSQNEKLHPVQQAFVETGAIQCGFCTPAQILTAKALLEKNADPTEAQIR